MTPIEPNLLVSQPTNDERIFVVTLNRAALRNTLSIETLKELTKTFKQLSQNNIATLIVLRGLGEAFAAGANIKELLALTPHIAVDFSLLGGNLFRTICNAPQLVIAAIDGYCMGGGLDLALSCDLRYASKQAIFAHPGANIGIITGFGGTYRLPKLIGMQKATELFATADRINALQALDCGLIQDFADNSTAYELALEKALDIVQLGKDHISKVKKLTRLASDLKEPQANLLLNRYHKLISSK
ncbi:MAG: enoyl-CoA hydratase/isomerase family protein [Blastocatellia bacterium]|nr:enoyl-CoA hydratase/isomerase family protein [Blastocatellia bacterium]MBN8725879.1 enoyl-CoA hydratase/isomerase family protein [Acidobacteriota bacterium]